MNINVLDRLVSRFSTVIHINQLKLSDLTDKKAVRLTDKEMLLFKNINSLGKHKL